MLKIELKFKDKVLKHIETDKSEITIGRAANNDIRVEDLNSTNGTHLNDIAVQKANLNPDDIVTIGKHDLKIASMDETKPAVEDLADKTIKVSG